MRVAPLTSDTTRALARVAERLIALAKQRITELSARRDATTQAIADLEATRPLGARPEEIETMLAAVLPTARMAESAVTHPAWALAARARARRRLPRFAADTLSQDC